MSSFGSPTGVTPESIIARSYHSGKPSRSASSMTASRPTRWRTSCGGTLPLRKPGSFISLAKLRAAAWQPLVELVGGHGRRRSSPSIRAGLLLRSGLRTELAWGGNLRACPEPLPFRPMARLDNHGGEPGRVALGTWSGGRFMGFGEKIGEERLEKLLEPGAGISTPCSPPTPTARAMPTGCSARRSRASTAATTASSARSATTSTRASATARAASPASPIPAFANRAPTPTTCGSAAERSLERTRRRSLRPAAPPQPRSHRLHVRGRLGRDGGPSRRGAGVGDRGRSRARRTASRSTCSTASSASASGSTGR